MAAQNQVPIQPQQQQQQQQQALYDQVNCDYEPAKNFQQNFGNPYDCPEGMYGGSVMSSVGYSQVSRDTDKLSSRGDVRHWLVG